MFKKIFGKRPPPVDTTALQAALGQVRALSERRDYDAALELARTSYAQAEQLLSPDDALLGLARNHLATLYVNTHQYAAAEPLYTAVLQSVRRSGNQNNRAFPIVMRNLIDLYLVQANYAAAEPLLSELADVQARAASAGLSATLLDLAEVSLKINKIEAAGRISAMLLPDIANFDPARQCRLAVLLGQVPLAAGNIPAARQFYAQGLALIEPQFGPNSPALIPLLTAMAEAWADDAAMAASFRARIRALEG